MLDIHRNLTFGELRGSFCLRFPFHPGWQDADGELESVSVKFGLE